MASGGRLRPAMDGDAGLLGLGQEDGPHLAEPRRRHDGLIRVIFGVALRAVGRLAEQAAGAIEDGDIVHDGS